MHHWFKRNFAGGVNFACWLVLRIVDRTVVPQDQDNQCHISAAAQGVPQTSGNIEAIVEGAPFSSISILAHYPLG